MPRFLIEISAPASIWAELTRNPQDRFEANRLFIEAAGGKLESFYFVAGADRVLLIAEFPDEVSLEAYTFAINSSGAAMIVKTSIILTAAETIEAMRKAGDVGYRPPTG